VVVDAKLDTKALFGGGAGERVEFKNLLENTTLGGGDAGALPPLHCRALPAFPAP